MEWIIKNPNFYWYVAFFLSEAVEASLCYFFENWLMKLKYPNLRIIQTPSNTILQAYFYLSGPNYFWRFNMRYPVATQLVLRLHSLILLHQHRVRIHFILSYSGSPLNTNSFSTIPGIGRFEIYSTKKYGFSDMVRFLPNSPKFCQDFLGFDQV